MKRKMLMVGLCAFICGIFSTALFKFGILEVLELKSLDYRFRLFSRPERASNDIVLVAIDERSLQEFKRQNVVWKWPRDIYAALVRYLSRGGAKVIVFDILFPDADIDRLSSDAEDTDGEFAAAMQLAGNVILAAHLGNEENLLNEDNPLTKQSGLELTPPEAIRALENYSSATLPIPLFQESASLIGVANYHDDYDGICRSLPLFSNFQDVVFPQLGLAVYLAANNFPKIRILSNNKLQIGTLGVPIDERNRFLINWYGRGGVDGCFQYYSIGALISSAIAEETGRTPILPSSIFRDKIALIGSNAPGLLDFRNTPFTTYEPYPAMEIYATMLSNLLQSDFLIRTNSYVSICVIFVFTFIVCFTFFYSTRIRIGMIWFLGCAIGWLLVAFALFHWQRIWVQLIAPEAAIMLGFVASAVLSYQAEGKARRRLRSIFSRYVSPVVVSDILGKKEEVELGGNEITATIFFSDIKDFASTSEQMNPKDLVIFLNDYFSLASEAILQNQGLLDKYIGDSIMAIFGAPISNENHAELACAAALDLQQMVEKTSKSLLNRQNQKPDFSTRIGISTGEVVVGNIGSQHRLDYTAIGDTVNLASRLEGINKVFSTNILLSESTKKLVDKVFLVRQIDKLRVKGKQESVLVYELIGRNEQISEDTARLVNQFDDGLRWYQERAFDKAKKVYESILASHPNDGPSYVYLDRCQEFLTSPPPINWDGVHIMETK